MHIDDVFWNSFEVFLTGGLVTSEKEGWGDI